MTTLRQQVAVESQDMMLATDHTIMKLTINFNNTTDSQSLTIIGINQDHVRTQLKKLYKKIWLFLDILMWKGYKLKD